MEKEVQSRLMKKMKKFSLAAAVVILLSVCVFFVSGQSSTAVTNTQFFSPVSTNSFGGAYSNLISGPSLTGNTSNGFFDMELFIPPAGCQPAIVRSDLLEEQNVPVFCPVVPLRLNPSIDITRIDSISFTQQTSNPYITGISFYPARAAIESRGTLTSAPTAENLGYVVVVLKRQTNENAMPDNITTTLAATLQYNAQYTFGLGTNEMLLPVMSDSDFSNNRFSYSFFDGIGFIRAENLDDTGATLSVYATDGTKVFSDRVEKGKTSRDLYLPTATGGQGMRLTLKDITVPQTKARISVNGRSFDVYKGGTFYDGKCSLVDLQAISGGTGTATVKCGSKTFNLQKVFNNINLIVNGNPLAISIGQKITEDARLSYYLAFTDQYNMLIANLSKDSISSLSDDAIRTRILSATKQIDSSLKGVNRQNADDVGKVLDNLVKSGVSAGLFSTIPVIRVTAGNKNPPLGIAPFNANSIQNSNTALTTDTQTQYNSAINGYEYVKTNFGAQTANDRWTYGEQALWKSYDLAKKLGQQDKMNEMLSRLENEYPQSRGTDGQTPSQLLLAGNRLSTEGSSASDDSQNIYIELVSIDEPAFNDANVNLNFNNQPSKNLGKGDIIYANMSNGGSQTITLASFDENNIYIDYSCTDKTGVVHSRTSYQGSKYFTIPECNAVIQVNKINVNKVADVQLIPEEYGRGQSSNFTFAIGIEKRPSFLKPTPEEAQDRMKKINEQISQLRNITDTLGKVIEAGNALCLATSAYLNIKNLFAGASGAATARTEVMSKWNNLCSSVEFQRNSSANNAQQCIANNDATIQKEITALAGAESAYNSAYEKESASRANQDANGKANNTKVKQAILTDLQNDLQSKYHVDFQTVALLKGDGTPVSAGDPARSMLTPDNINQLTTTEISGIYAELQMANNSAISADERIQYQKNAYTLLNQYYQREKTYQDSMKASTATGLLDSQPLSGVVQQIYAYNGYVWSSDLNNKFNMNGVSITDGKPVAKLNNYLYVLSSKTDPIEIDRVYKISYDASGKPGLGNLTNSREDSVASGYRFRQSASYHNKCLNCDHMTYFTLDPYKGLPALLPFDGDNGWYVQVKQLYPGLGNQKSYQDSGRVNSFWLCNVAQNGLMEGVGLGDPDICKRFDMSTGDTLDSFPGLSQSEAKIEVSKAIAAIESAEKQLTDNPKATEIIINGMHLKTGTSEGSTGSKCTDFMSASDCQILFNVCDPFVCPASRCDLGGKNPVDNVIASGLLGSTILCLPNFIGLSGNEHTGVIVPVCLTGINAGLDDIAAILESYRDCLNASIASNQTVGICDEIESAYFCDLFWRQAQPFSDAIFKNIFYMLEGGGADKGGGEYLFLQDAWNNAQKTSQYFTNTYAKNAQYSFGFKDITQLAVAQVCKMPVSADYPSNFKTALTPASPTQFSAWFEENSYSSATVPPTSQYDVFYQIYAGKDQGHYYQVYLKSTPTALGYTGKDYTLVATGYVAAGQSASEKKDFLDVSGFQQLCVKIDNVEKCGFKSVSTSFALNYATQSATSAQATENVTSESQCISGSSNAGAFLTPNLEQGVDQFINPDLYNQGIVRTCSTDNPGAPTDLTRWKYVGYCDDKNIGCWIDTRSVQNAITANGIQNMTLAQINNLSSALTNNPGYFDSKTGGPYINDLETVYKNIVDQIVRTTTNTSIGSGSYTGTNIKDYAGSSYVGRTLNSFDNDVDALAKKLIDPSQKAALYEFKAETYDSLARAFYTARGAAQSPAGTAANAVSTNNPIPSVIYNPASGQLELNNGAGTTYFFTKTSDGYLQYVGKNIGTVDSSGTIHINPDWLTPAGIPTSDHSVIIAQLDGKAFSSFQNQASTNAGGGTITTGGVSEPNSDFFAKTLAVCSWVGLGSGSAAATAASYNKFTSSAIGSEMLSAVENAPAASIQEGVMLTDSAGNALPLVKTVAGASGITYVRDASGNILGTVNSAGNVVNNGKIVENLLVPKTAKLVDATGNALKAASGEALTLENVGNAGTGVLLDEAGGGLKLISGTSKYFASFLKAAPIIGDTLKVVGKIAAPLTYAGLICDAGLTVWSGAQYVNAVIIEQQSGAAADASLGNDLTAMNNAITELAPVVQEIQLDYTILAGQNSQLANQVKPQVQALNSNMDTLRALDSDFARKYTNQYGNSGGELGSKFTIAEWTNLMNDVKQFRSTYVSSYNNATALQDQLVTYVGD